jgi:DNA-binding CsgD family transcriptional regulator/catechol 2,3-dioxygenase-like lactoylglutathione lyase family enzyme
MKPSRPRGRPAHADTLTPAEWRVAEAVRHGLTNRAIADRLEVSIDAVKFHVGNTLSKLGMARRADLRSWAGVRADSNLAQTEASSGKLDIGQIGQIARSVANIETAVAWYAGTLGLPHLFTAGSLGFFDCGGTRLMLSEGDGAADSILYFSVPDIRAAHLELQARGVVFVAAPHMIHRHPDGTEEWMAFFHDNQGRPLAIMAHVPASQESDDA